MPNKESASEFPRFSTAGDSLILTKLLTRSTGCMEPDNHFCQEKVKVSFSKKTKKLAKKLVNKLCIKSGCGKEKYLLF